MANTKKDISLCAICGDMGDIALMVEIKRSDRVSFVGFCSEKCRDILFEQLRVVTSKNFNKK